MNLWLFLKKNRVKRIFMLENFHLFPYGQKPILPNLYSKTRTFLDFKFELEPEKTPALELEHVRPRYHLAPKNLGLF